MATALGILLGLSPWLALIALIAFIVVAALARYASLASILAALAAAAVSPILLGWEPNLVAVMGIAALVVWRHRANIRRLRSGTEGKLNLRRGNPPPPT